MSSHRPYRPALGVEARSPRSALEPVASTTPTWWGLRAGVRGRVRLPELGRRRGLFLALLGRRRLSRTDDRDHHDDPDDDRDDGRRCYCRSRRCSSSHPASGPHRCRAACYGTRRRPRPSAHCCSRSRCRAERLDERVVPEHRVRRIVVQDLLHLVDDLLALRRIHRLRLLDVQRVVLRVGYSESLPFSARLAW